MDFTRPERCPGFLEKQSWSGHSETSVWITAVLRKHPLSKWTITRPAVGQVREIVADAPCCEAKGDTPPPMLPPTQFPLLLHARGNLTDQLSFTMKNSIRAPGPTLALQTICFTHLLPSEDLFLFSRCCFARPSSVCSSANYTHLAMLLLFQSHKSGSMLQAQSVKKILFSTSLLQNLCCLFPLPSKMQKVVIWARPNPGTGKPTPCLGFWPNFLKHLTGITLCLLPSELPQKK